MDLANVQKDDVIFTKRSDQEIVLYLVEKVTKTMLVTDIGTRFRIENGREIGNYSRQETKYAKLMTYKIWKKLYSKVTIGNSGLCGHLLHSPNF